MEAREQAVRQSTITLPYFEQEVPALYVADGEPYIPVIALCQMLGLRANTHIPRWRKLVLWCNARKLPWQTPTGRTRVVWCLHAGALPFWCCCFDWSIVTTIRRAQLHQALDAWLKPTEQAQQEMLREYRQMRSRLFKFLTTYRDAHTQLIQIPWDLRPRLDVESCLQLEGLVYRGVMLMDGVTSHARKMVHEQATIPIVNAITIDSNSDLIETRSFPLFPVVPREDREQFFEYLNMLTRWYRDLAAFLEEKGLSHTRDHEK